MCSQPQRLVTQSDCVPADPFPSSSGKLSTTGICSPIPLTRISGTKQRILEGHVIGFLEEFKAGIPDQERCCEHGFEKGSYYVWRSKLGGMGGGRTGGTMTGTIHGRQSTTSASCFAGRPVEPGSVRYQPVLNRIHEPRVRIMQLTQWHKCYGTEMTFLKRRLKGL